MTYPGPLWIPGHPITKGSDKCVTPHIDGARSRLVPDNPKLPDWESKIADMVGYGMSALRRTPFIGPVELVCDFEMIKPRRTKYADAPVGRGHGDLDKLLRAVGDALTQSGVYRDDSLVTRIVAEKVYSPTNREGVTVELRPYDPPPATPCGRMPVRIQAGRGNYRVGSIDHVRGLPNLLRQVADQMERTAHDR